jgi:hypothetical protein
VRRAGNHGREKEEKSEKKMLERWKIIDGQARSPYRFEWLRGWQAILIGILSTAGYGLAYVHELGVSGVFGIPQDFIVLNLTTILITIGEVLAVGTGTLGVIGMAYLFSLSVKDEKWRRIVHGSILIFILIAFILALLIRYPSVWPEMVLIAPMILFYVFVGFVLPIFRQRGVRGYRQKLKAQDEFERKSLEPVRDFVSRRFGARFFLAMIIGVLLLGFIFLAAYFSGVGGARSQEKFLVTSTTPQLVALREYGDNLICAQFDRDEKLFARQLVVLRAGANPELVLRLERLGPLKMGELVTQTWQPVP